jgi:hypothetical protein
MKKYYFATIYKTEDGELFQSREALIEYVRDNWQEYCQPYGEDKKLVSIQDWEGRIIFTYSTTGDDGEAGRGGVGEVVVDVDDLGDHAHPASAARVIVFSLQSGIRCPIIAAANAAS